jgi:hypothetical protein
MHAWFYSKNTLKKFIRFFARPVAQASFDVAQAKLARVMHCRLLDRRAVNHPQEINALRGKSCRKI